MRVLLKKDIIELFRSRFENDCISLLLDAYGVLKESGRDLTQETENNITAQLLGAIKASPRRYELEISVDREHYQDNEQIYAGIENADTSARVDLKFSTWDSSREYLYSMEAKNLSENNRSISGRKTPIDAGALRKRYIATGVDHFISGKYGKGCLLGYVLEGDTSGIVELINALLSASFREKEFLIRQSDHDFDGLYRSHHAAIDLSLKHFFLKFSN